MPGCGHTQGLPCHEAKNLDAAFCKEDEHYQMPGCGHWLAVFCSELKSPENIKYTATCGTLLSCGTLAESHALGAASCRKMVRLKMIMVSVSTLARALYHLSS